MANTRLPVFVATKKHQKRIQRTDSLGLVRDGLFEASIYDAKIRRDLQDDCDFRRKKNTIVKGNGEE